MNEIWGWLGSNRRPLVCVCCKSDANLGGSPSLVHMGDNSCLKGLWVRIPVLYGGWTFFTLICCKNCFFEKAGNKQKRGRGRPIFFKKKWRNIPNVPQQLDTVQKQKKSYKMYFALKWWFCNDLWRTLMI